MNERIYIRMRNTLNDIERIVNSAKSNSKKESNIKTLIAILRSAECNEISEMEYDTKLDYLGQNPIDFYSDDEIDEWWTIPV